MTARRILVAAALLATVAAGTSCRRKYDFSGSGVEGATATATASSQGQANVVRLLLVNDVYVADTLRDGTGGLARVAHLRDSIERATGGSVLYVLAGDVLSPSVLGKWYGGAQMVEAFNASRLDIATLGNHEFDGSRANLLARLGESRFRWLSGNCTEANGTPFPGVRGWDTVRVNGVRVGVFGTTVVRDYPAYVRCRDADSATTALVDTLQRIRADVIVGVTHRFQFEDSLTLVSEPRITAILGGHDHNGRRFEFGGRLLTKAVSNARTASLVTLERNGTTWRASERVFRIGAGIPDEPRVAAVVQRWRDTLERRIGPDRVLGVAPEPINAVDSTSKRESRFGNLIADAMRLGTGADVAMINAGALRFDDVMAAGPITRHMFEGVFLFADETRAVTFPLTGARLRAVLEHGVSRTSLLSGPYPQVSGVRFSFDARQPSGARLVGGLTRDDGRTITPTDTLRVTFVAYPACRGGDGYVIPEAATVCATMAATPTAAPRTTDLVLRHLESMNGRIVAPPVGRVTRIDR
ncbi:MAG TPA: 5'-nucleotidase C-terminal domain-containing protein [Gemmatimonas sp.]|nr:5'-nucleotidase C-terminal domain-containing protein [Gemmatimonas sp.]